MNLWCRGESLVPHFHGHGTWGAREIEMGKEVIESGERIRRQAEECQEERERERERLILGFGFGGIIEFTSL